MKKVILIIALVAISLNLKAQTEDKQMKKYRSQLNIGYFNLFSLSSQNSFGIGYKYSIKNGALRIGSSFSYSNANNKFSSSTNPQTSNSRSFNIDPKIGYEFHRDFNKFQILYGTDIKGYYQNSITKNTSYNATVEVVYIYEKNTYGIGISPFIGLKYQINNFISITTETSFDILYSKSKSKDENNSYIAEYELENTSAKISPLGIVSLNIHF
jgi:hypothetical protein